MFYQLANKLHRSGRGQSLVEIALVLPILLIILLGILEFGRVFHSYLVITHAAREGARYGVISKNADDIRQKVQQSSPGIELDLANDIMLNPEASFPTGSPLTVQVNCEVELFTPVLGEILPNPVVLSAESTMLIE